jgi:hypothetical protein
MQVLNLSMKQAWRIKPRLWVRSARRAERILWQDPAMGTLTRRRRGGSQAIIAPARHQILHEDWVHIG